MYGREFRSLPVYRKGAELVRRNERIDCVNVKMGIRNFLLTLKGISFKWYPYPAMRGVSRHQDRLSVGERADKRAES